MGASHEAPTTFICSRSAVAAEEDNESDENDPEAAVAAVKKIAKTVHGVPPLKSGGFLRPSDIILCRVSFFVKITLEKIPAARYNR